MNISVKLCPQRPRKSPSKKRKDKEKEERGTQAQARVEGESRRGRVVEETKQELGSGRPKATGTKQGPNKECGITVANTFLAILMSFS